MSISELTNILPTHAHGFCLFLDFDGTLSPIQEDPLGVQLHEENRKLIELISAHPKNNVIIVSGRGADFLKSRFTGLNVSLSAEHGRFYYESVDSEEAILLGETQNNLDNVTAFFSSLTKKHPGTFQEQKSASLAFHYRTLADPSRESSLLDTIKKSITELDLEPHTIFGNKVVEVKTTSASKGTFVKWYIEQHYKNSDICHVSIGDDATDEQMFPPTDLHGGISIRVSQDPLTKTTAQYTISSTDEVTQVLHIISRLACSGVS